MSSNKQTVHCGVGALLAAGLILGYVPVNLAMADSQSERLIGYDSIGLVFPGACTAWLAFAVLIAACFFRGRGKHLACFSMGLLLLLWSAIPEGTSLSKAWERLQETRSLLMAPFAVFVVLAVGWVGYLIIGLTTSSKGT